MLSADNEPLIVTQRFGQGKVAAILSNSLWRWQLEPGQQDEYLAFWDGLMEWLMPQALEVDQFSLDLSADVEQLFLGDTLNLTAHASGSKADSGLPVSIEIQTPDGRKIPYPAQASGQGVYTVAYKADAAGMCTAVAKATVDGRDVSSPAFSFYVKPFTPESAPRPQNVELLQQLAKTSGGQFCEPSQLDAALASIDLKPSRQETIRYDSLWDSPFVLAGLMLLLISDWILRKHRQMA